VSSKTKGPKGAGAKARRMAYRDSNRRNIHKANKLARRWKYYKVQPPKALNGLSDVLRRMIENKLANNKIERNRKE